MMDSETTSMTQDTDNLLDAPKAVRLRGSSMRRWTGITQASMSLVLVCLGVTLLLIRPFPNGHDTYDGIVFGLRIIHNCAIGIWGGLVFFITGTVGVFSNRTKSMVSLYLALCLASLLIAVIGVGSSGSAVGLNVFSKEEAFHYCRDELEDVDYDYRTVDCCLSHYDCPRPGYGTYGPSDKPPLGLDCKEIKAKHGICVSKVINDANSRMPLYAVTVAIFVLECFFALLGASFTCIGLCDCRKKQDKGEESSNHFHWSSKRSTGTSGYLPASNNFASDSQAPRFILLNTAAQPVQFKNHNDQDVSSSPTPMQFIPVAQASQMVTSSGQVFPI